MPEQVKEQRFTHRQRQAQATRQLIATTARRLFTRHGYGATTMESIATDAGVSVRTVYAVFRTKRDVLAAVCDDWLAEAEVIPLMQLALAEPNAGRRLDLVARSTRQQWERGGDILTIFEAAKQEDKETATLLEGWLDQRRNVLRAIIEPLGFDTTTVAPIVFALTAPALYEELVRVGGWPPDRYERWLSAVLKREVRTRT